MSYGFLRSVALRTDTATSFDVYPLAIPAIRHLGTLKLDAKVTFFVGENGAGKSTLLEAIAVLAGFNAEGGSKNFSFATKPQDAVLTQHLRLARSTRKERNGFFLRAESFFNAATYLDELGGGSLAAYGGKSLHEQSHGESFLALANHRFGANGLYLLDEPESALSPQRQLSLLQIIHRLVEHESSQFVIATHSPILLAYPGAKIVHFDGEGIATVAYEDTEHYRLTRDFLADPKRFLRALFAARDNDDDNDAEE